MTTIVKFVAWAVRVAIRLFPWLSAAHRLRVSPKAKCPWCGAVKRHEIHADIDGLAIVHRCAVCGGVWGVRPITAESELRKMFRQPTEAEERKRSEKL